MTPLLASIADGAERVVRIVGECAAWLGLALVLLVAGNVLGRYLFGLSTVGMQEAEWHLMAVGALFGMSYGLNQGGEVRVDVFFDGFSERNKALVDAISGFMLTACAIVITLLSIRYVEQSYSINEGSPDPGGLPYRYVLKAMVPLAFAILSLQGLAMFLRAIARIAALARPHQPAQTEPF